MDSHRTPTLPPGFELEDAPLTPTHRRTAEGTTFLFRLTATLLFIGVQWEKDGRGVLGEVAPWISPLPAMRERILMCWQVWKFCQRGYESFIHSKIVRSSVLRLIRCSKIETGRAASNNNRDVLHYRSSSELAASCARARTRFSCHPSGYRLAVPSLILFFHFLHVEVLPYPASWISGGSIFDITDSPPITSLTFSLHKQIFETNSNRRVPSLSTLLWDLLTDSNELGSFGTRFLVLILSQLCLETRLRV